MTLIALKREVAVEILQVFRGANVKLENWRQVTVQINCPAMTGNNVWITGNMPQDTHGSVYSHRLSYLAIKVRKGGDFFYGKSSNENHIKSI